MTPQEFIRKWKPAALTERASAQEHFIDLCRVFGHSTPVEDDPVGGHFCRDHQLIAIARDDDTTFDVLHSRFHEDPRGGDEK